MLPATGFYSQEQWEEAEDERFAEWSGEWRREMYADMIEDARLMQLGDIDEEPDLLADQREVPAPRALDWRCPEGLTEEEQYQWFAENGPF